MRSFLTAQLERNRELRRAAEANEGPQLMAAELRKFQVRRLQHTFADLHEQPRYQEAIDFFIEELYNPDSFDSRDKELERIVPMMMRLLPAHLIDTLAHALELQALSQELDMQLAEAMEKLGVAADSEAMSDGDYAAGYQRCDNRRDREHQIALIERVGRELDGVTDKAFVYTALRLCRRPAKAAGLGELQRFLERGFHAYRSMEGAEEFLQTIIGRENAILDNLMAGREQPFDVA